MKSNYFQNQLSMANENFQDFNGNENLNADGDWADNYASAFGDDEMPFEGQDMLNANGNGGGARASQPYVIRVRNSTTDDVDDVVILDAARRQNNYAVSGVAITYRLSNLNYGQFLAGINGGRTFNAGLVRLQATNSSSSSNAEAQVLTTVTVETIDLNNNKVSMTLIPLLDNYAQQKQQTDLRGNFLVDGLTKMTFETIKASTTLDIYIFPAAKVDVMGQLRGQGRTQYKNPHINPALKG